MVTEKHLSRDDAYMLASVAADLHITELVYGNKGVHMMLHNSIFGMDTSFTRENAKGSTADAQAEIAPGEICGNLPKGFDPKAYRTKPWHVSFFIHDGVWNKLGGRTVEVIATPGHTPDSIALLDRENGLLFTGDTYYPAPIWLFRPETDLT